MTYMQCNLNTSQASKTLYVLRNSLQYPIDKFIERTGRHFQ
ncbi:helix-turn-helix domain-containing protein [Bacillus stratosphericus]